MRGKKRIFYKADGRVTFQTPRQLQGLLLSMLGVCVAVLFLACSNVMNMQFARATLRAKELAIRSSLGATRWHAFWSITLPLSLPGVLAGAVLGFARSIGEFGATITFVSNIPGETRTLPIAIYSALQIPSHEAEVTRLAILSVLLSLAALILSEWLARRSAAGKGAGHVL